MDKIVFAHNPFNIAAPTQSLFSKTWFWLLVAVVIIIVIIYSASKANAEIEEDKID